MNKRITAPLPSFAKFRTDFLSGLKSRYKAKPLIPAILRDKALREHCADLLWPCVNGSSAGLVALSKTWVAYWDAKIEAARAELDNVKSVECVYKILDPQPKCMDFLASLRSDLLEKQRKRRQVQQPTLSFKRLLGRDQDWVIVMHTKETLESVKSMEPLLGGLPLPDATLAALLNAACEAAGLNAARAAAGLKVKNYSARSIHVALKRLKARFDMTH